MRRHICGEAHPTESGITCTKQITDKCFGQHFGPPGFPPWPAATIPGPKTNKSVMQKIVDETPREEPVGPPPRPSDTQVKQQDRDVIEGIYAGWDSKEASAHWIEEAMPIARRVCEQVGEITTDLWWPHLTFPIFEGSNSGGRIIGRVVNKVLTAGWMERWMLPDGSMRGYPSDLLDVVYSKDGVRIQHQKIVPIYRSLVVHSVSVAPLRDFG